MMVNTDVFFTQKKKNNDKMISGISILSIILHEMTK
jgi:hypothetical protein